MLNYAEAKFEKGGTGAEGFNQTVADLTITHNTGSTVWSRFGSNPAFISATFIWATPTRSRNLDREFMDIMGITRYTGFGGGNGEAGKHKVFPLMNWSFFKFSLSIIQHHFINLEQRYI